MAGRVEKLRHYDENVTRRRSINLIESDDIASDAIARNDLKVPSAISPFTTTVFAAQIQIDFENAEKVEVVNAPLSSASRSDLVVYLIQADAAQIGPYTLAAYAEKTFSIRQGFIGVLLSSDASGTYATVEAFHV